MDFITIATESSRGLRWLDEAISTTTQDTETRPLLSKSAEAELYLLATNFLLYVAMVIITTMVAKIYFPESLERGNAPPIMRTRSYSYMRTAPSRDEEDEEDDYYGSDEEEVDEYTDELLDSDDNEDVPLQQRELESQQESLNRGQVMRRLVFCSLMLNITFVCWGVLQERMLTRKYPRFTGEYFTYSYWLVFSNRFWTTIMSGLLWLYLRPRPSQTTVIYEYSFPSISNMLSSWCQYEALRYVSFPAATLFKAFKLAPVMAMGKILGNKSYPQYDYIVALLIGVGIAMFMTSTDDLHFGEDYLGNVSSQWTGVMLLFFYLFFDSFTSQFQSRMFQRHRDLSMVELMLATSAFSTVLSFITLLHTKEVYPAITFVQEHSEIHLHFFLFSICSTVGQLFIFYTIRNFGAVVFTLIMTTRILLSISISCVLYGHNVTATGFFGLLLVMAAVIYRIRRKAQGQQLFQWKGMGDAGEKAFELVQEWHEHVDM
jgi:adenosine 3'-phospho 5'-phosphosulfate transporter B2